LNPFFPNKSMDDLKTIFARASARAAEKKLPYAGALLPAEANAILLADSDARLVDVRTQAELDWVGHVPGALTIEWNSWPGGEKNPHFIEKLKNNISSSRAALLFLCRSGARSHNAAIAATLAGYANSFNVLEGFEGDKDENGHRNTRGGWRAAGLPWVQS
jgi:rhodanese-related sulfurtransferase